MRTGFYGYGFNVGTTSAARMELSHSGAFELGAGTNFVILPSADVAIVALTNATPGGLPETLTARIRRPGAVRRGTRGLVQAVHRRVQADGRAVRARWSASSRRRIPRPPRRCRPTSAPTTTTTGDRRGSVRRTASCNSSSGTKLDVPLTHWDGNVFTYSWVCGELAAGNGFEGDVRREQADARVLRRNRQGNVHPMTAVVAAGLSDAEVAQRVAEGKTNDVPTRAARSVSDIVRANVFTRINAILGVLLDHRAVDRVGDQRRVRAADHRQQRDRHHPGAARQADAGQARDRRAGETVGAQAVRDRRAAAQRGGARRHHRTRARRPDRRRRRHRRGGQPRGRRVAAHRRGRPDRQGRRRHR